MIFINKTIYCLNELINYFLEKKYLISNFLLLFRFHLQIFFMGVFDMQYCQKRVFNHYYHFCFAYLFLLFETQSCLFHKFA